MKNCTFSFINRVCFPISAIDYTFIRLPRVTCLCLVTIEKKNPKELVIILLTLSTIYFNNVTGISCNLMEFLQLTFSIFLK